MALKTSTKEEVKSYFLKSYQNVNNVIMQIVFCALKVPKYCNIRAQNPLLLMAVNINASFRPTMAMHALAQSKKTQECAKNGEERERRGRTERKKGNEERKERKREERNFATVLLEHRKGKKSHYLFTDFDFSTTNHQS